MASVIFLAVDGLGEKGRLPQRWPFFFLVEWQLQIGASPLPIAAPRVATRPLNRATNLAALG